MEAILTYKHSDSEVCKFHKSFLSLVDYYDSHVTNCSECIEKFQTSSENLPVSRNLGLQLWNRSGDKDFTFVVGGKEIRVHKFIIIDCHVFERMIDSGMQESKENKVTITDFSFETVEIALKYFYGIEIRDFFTVNNAFNVLRFADKYDIKDLKIFAETFLSSQISATNICIISNSSILSNSIKIRGECFEFLLNCMKNSIFVKDLDLLDKNFAFELFKAQFFHASL